MKAFSRRKEIDLIKSVAILMVVFGHCIEFGSGPIHLARGLHWINPIYKFIYGLHMPLFMMISGYLFKNSVDRYHPIVILKRKFTQCMVPVISFTVISLGLQVLRNRGGIGWEVAIRQLFVQLWFLWAVFLWSVVVLAIHTFAKDSILLYLLVFIVSMMIPNVGYTYLWMYMYPFFLCGFLYRSRKTEFPTNPIMSFCLLILYIILLILWTPNTYIYNSKYCIISGEPVKQVLTNLFRMITGFVGSCFAISTLTKCSKLIVQREWSRRAIDYLSILGVNSMGIYVFSVYLNHWLLGPFTKWVNGFNILFCIIESAFMIAFCLLFCNIIKRIKLAKFLFFGGR